MTSDTDVIDAIAGSSQILDVVKRATLSVADSGDFTASVLASDSLSRQFEISAQQAAVDYAQQPAFRAMVQEVAGGLPDNLGRDIEEIRVALAQLHDRIDTLPGGGADSQRLGSVERGQANLAILMTERQTNEERLIEQLEHLVAELAALRTEVAEDQSTIQDLLAGGVDYRGASSYLLKGASLISSPSQFLTIARPIRSASMKRDGNDC